VDIGMCFVRLLPKSSVLFIAKDSPPAGPTPKKPPPSRVPVGSNRLHLGQTLCSTQGIKRRYLSF
jgi:hypothetical protein